MTMTSAKEKAAARSSPTKKTSSNVAKEDGTVGKRGTAKEERGLRLPSLDIEGFRGIRKLHLLEFGRVTLLVGKNGAGKSTILEAVKLYASAGSPRVMDNILKLRESLFVVEDGDGRVVDVPDHGSLFFGHETPELNSAIKIGCGKSRSVLEIGISSYKREELDGTPLAMVSSLMERDSDSGVRCLVINYGFKRRKKRKIPFFAPGDKGEEMSPLMVHELLSRPRLSRFWGISDFRDDALIAQIPLQMLGPGIPSNEKIAKWYQAVDMKPEEERVLEAMRFIDPNIERISIHMGQRETRRIMVKMGNMAHPLPLKSMGDGMFRLLGVALSLVNARDGFLLIDEVENGIHYSLYPKLWNFVMQVAQNNNVQVIAATHGWSCLAGFAEAALELGKNNIEGRLIRIVKEGDEVRSVTYSGKDLAVAAKMNLEVR